LALQTFGVLGLALAGLGGEVQVVDNNEFVNITRIYGGDTYGGGVKYCSRA